MRYADLAAAAPRDGIAALEAEPVRGAGVEPIVVNPAGFADVLAKGFCDRMTAGRNGCVDAPMQAKGASGDGADGVAPGDSPRPRLSSRFNPSKLP